MYLLIFLAVVFLAYSNGTNDNFKGVATLFGSDTTNYRKAILWATATTLLGSILSVFLASTLVKNFSGMGLVPEKFLTPAFAIAVSMGAALTVILATKIGMPISTTHGIIGALIGVGLIAAWGSLNLGKLESSFFLPLIASPIIAAMLSFGLYPAFSIIRRRMGITKESCVCLTGEANIIATANNCAATTVDSAQNISIKTGTISSCSEPYTGTIIGISAQKALDTAHFISGGAVSFARGLNDTPKMVGLLLLIQVLNIKMEGLALAVAIATGGLLMAQKVGMTMSKQITGMNHGQGFTANIITAILVTTASFNGLPVSTTHVSVGSIFGIGVHTKKANIKVIREIILSWVLTLPVSALLGALIYEIISHFNF